MAEVVCLHSKHEVERFCRRNVSLHLYALGDLDDFFWPHTTWYALREEDQVRQLVLLYTGQPLPVVLAHAEQPIELMRDLMRDLMRVLPRRFYAHLTEGIAEVLAHDYRVQPHGTHHKMSLTDGSNLTRFDGSEAIALSAAHTDDLLALYSASYPGNWFVPRTLETGFYYGIRRGRALVSFKKSGTRCLVKKLRLTRLTEFWGTGQDSVTAIGQAVANHGQRTGSLATLTRFHGGFA